MEPIVTTRNAELEAVRARRAELRESMSQLEHALAAPATDRAVIWAAYVHSVLADMAEDFVEHVEVTEGPGGLHHAIMVGDLRLANAVNALAAEHPQIAAEIARLVADTESRVPPDVDLVRERGTNLLSGLVRHRQRGADLIYEAYETDIGGGD
jgi:hypothetical protein